MSDAANIYQQSLGVNQGLMANEMRNLLLKQQLGTNTSGLKRLLKDGEDADDEVDQFWVSLEHTEFSQDNKNAMALLLLLSER
jgi:hypothetical protein